MDITIKEVINFLDANPALIMGIGSFTETNIEIPEREEGISLELTDANTEQRIIIDLFADGYVHCYKMI